jgi:hypothetical protein
MLTIPGTQPNTMVEFRRGPDGTIQTRGFQPSFQILWGRGKI